MNEMPMHARSDSGQHDCRRANVWFAGELRQRLVHFDASSSIHEAGRGDQS